MQYHEDKEELEVIVYTALTRGLIPDEILDQKDIYIISAFLQVAQSEEKDFSKVLFFCRPEEYEYEMFYNKNKFLMVRRTRKSDQNERVHFLFLSKGSIQRFKQNETVDLENYHEIDISDVTSELYDNTALYAIRHEMIKQGIDMIEAEHILELIRMAKSEQENFSNILSYPPSPKYYYEISHRKKYKVTIIHKIDSESEKIIKPFVAVGKKEDRDNFNRANRDELGDEIKINITNVVRDMRISKKEDKHGEEQECF